MTRHQVEGNNAMGFRENASVDRIKREKPSGITIMPLDEKEIDYLEQHIPELAEIATKQAYWQALASGRSVVQLDNGVIYEVFPDGSR